MNEQPTPNSSAATLAMIRVMVLGGVLLFGAVIWLLYRNGSRTPVEPNFPVTPIALGLWGVAIVGLLVLRARWGAESEPTRRGHLSIFAIAVAEVPALFGAVVYFFSNDPRLYVSGVFLMLTTLLLFPIVRHR